MSDNHEWESWDWFVVGDRKDGRIKSSELFYGAILPNGQALIMQWGDMEHRKPKIGPIPDKAKFIPRDEINANFNWEDARFLFSAEILIKELSKK